MRSGVSPTAMIVTSSGATPKFREDSLRDQVIYRAQGSHGNDLAFQVSHGSNLRARDQIKTGLGHHREHTSQRRALDGPADAAAEGGGVINAARPRCRAARWWIGPERAAARFRLGGSSLWHRRAEAES